MKRTVRGLVLGCHPGPTLVVTTIATGLAVGVGQTTGGVLLVAVTVLVGQLSIGWSNDWLDASRDVAGGRTDKPVAGGEISAGALRAAALVALMMSIPLSFLNGVAAGFAHLGLVASGWAYNLGLKKTWWSWLPYAVGFGLLPAFVTLSLPGSPWPPWWATAAGALLGVGAHFANVLPDIEGDLEQGVAGLPQRMGALRAGVAALVLLVGAVVLLVFAPAGTTTLRTWLGLTVVLLLAAWSGAVLSRRGDLSLVFRAAMLIALVAALLLVDAAALLLVP